jgi:hypothetical protein
MGENDGKMRVGSEGVVFMQHGQRTYLVHVDSNLLKLVNAVAHPRQLDLLLCVCGRGRGRRGRMSLLAWATQ